MASSLPQMLLYKKYLATLALESCIMAVDFVTTAHWKMFVIIVEIDNWDVEKNKISLNILAYQRKIWITLPI